MGVCYSGVFEHDWHEVAGWMDLLAELDFRVMCQQASEGGR